MENIKISKEFILSRLQSLTGFALVFFLIEHLITNSQVVLFFNEGSRFVKMVNFYQSIPYLKFVEITLIAIPFIFHIGLGAKYLGQSDINSIPSDGKRPSLTYNRNKIFTLQRLTAYIIALFLIFHIVEMRFIKYPKKIYINGQEKYLVKLNSNKNLYKAGKRLNIQIVEKNNQNFIKENKLEKVKLKNKKVIAIADSFGKATLISVFNTFQSPFEIIIYSIFVLASSFHAINGLYTFLLSWGVIFSLKHQKLFSIGSCAVGFIVTLIGFVSIFGNLIFGVR